MDSPFQVVSAAARRLKAEGVEATLEEIAVAELLAAGVVTLPEALVIVTLDKDAVAAAAPQPARQLSVSPARDFP